MNTYITGNVVRLKAEYQNTSGVDTDPTAAICKVKDPTGTITSYTPVKDSTGNYHYDLTLSLDGVYWYRFEGTGLLIAANEASVYSGPSQFV